MDAQILIADDELNLRKVLSAILRRQGYEVWAAADGAEALSLMREHEFQVVITDLKMPGIGGMEVLKRARAESPGLPVIVITAHGTIDTAVEALKTGAFDYITKPFEQEEIVQVVQKALATAELSAQEVQAEPAIAGELTSGGEAAPVTTGAFDIVGRSREMQDVFQIIRKVADTPSTVLITGESGTGKELIAKALHTESARKDKPFIAINCAAIPKTLMESELFGYEKGAFTGATTSKPGRFELAHGGTLFLDEVGEIPLEMQVKLLRALQEGEFERVGGVRTIKVDVRLIAATNRDLEKDIAAGGFREDLYYRIHVVPVALAPLRDRRDDVPLLVQHFIEKYNRRLKKSVRDVSDSAMAALMAYSWPGNIRELENVLERALLFAESERLDLPDLPTALRERVNRAEASAAAETATALAAGMAPASAAPQTGSLKAIVKETTLRIEKDLIQRALTSTAGNVTRAAKLLKISRKGLQNKMKEFGLREHADAGTLPQG